MFGNRLALVSIFLVAMASVASAVEFEVNVAAGDTALRNAPVRVPVDFGAGDAQAVSLSGDGFIGMGQISPAGLASADGAKSELCFVIPYLPANEKLTIIGKTVAPEEAKNGFEFDSQQHTTTMSVGGNDRKILRCMREPIDRSSPQRIGETYKVFHHVYDPTGSRYVTKGPGGLFPHHRGLFFGFNRISYGDDQKADIWHCKNGEHQAHKSEELLAGTVFGRETSSIDWHGRDDNVFAKEMRELTAYNVEGGVLIEFATLLESQVGAVRLDGDPQHAGFQFLATQEVPDKTKEKTYYLRPDGKGKPGVFRNWSAKENETEQNLAHINLPWNALCFELDGKRYTCCYLDHPQNPKPARFSERDYGRFGSYFEYDMDTDKPLKLNYRIWLQEGEMTVDEVNELSQSFVSPPEVTVTVTAQPEPEVASHEADREGFVSIFDGKSLEGWDGDPKFWTVKDGAITGTTTEEVAIKNGNTFIIWEGGDLADFELKLQYKIIGHPRGNSGIQYRSFRLPDNNDNKWRIGGYQADFETGDRYSGICYGEGYRGILALRGEVARLTRVDGNFKKEVVGSVGDAAEIGSKIKKEDWNDYHIIARGNHLVHKINGVTTMELTDEDEQMRKDGLLALQLHAGPPMEVQFRNIRVKHLGDKANASVQNQKKKVVFVAGTRSHGYGAHEHNAGCLLLAKQLKTAMPNFECDVHQNGWPHNGMDAFEGADAVVVYCDGGGRHLLNPHIDEFRQLMDKGVGLACIHYGVEVPKGKSGDAFLNWIGGYFETHWSVNPHWTAEFKEFPNHPVSNGVKPFAINDEWYFHMRFRDGMEGVTPILSAVAPDETMKRPDGAHSGNPHVRKAVAAGEPQHVAWVSENENGGRGFGFTGGHRHWNWGDDNFRKVALNAICWVAKADVPANGVATDTPSESDLEANQDFPKPKKKVAQTAPELKKKRTDTSLVTIPVALNSEQQDGSHDPEKAVANMDVHPELKAQLLAAEPLMLSPSGIDIDHKGRIWVCEVVNYRDFANRNNPVRAEGDRILILEDTDHDGAADKKTVFYQGRDIDSPHGICVLGNRVIVSANGKVFNFYDDNGDDKPDRKEVMYSGISGANHDHGIHAFQFGPDGKLYWNFGNEGKQLLTPDGKPVMDMAGNVVKADRDPYQQGMVFRQDLDDTRLETLGWNFRNNWMVTVDSFGTIWQSDNDDDGNRGVRINFVMEFGNYGYRDEFTGAGWRTERTNMSELPAKHWYQRDPGVVPNMLHTGAGSPTGLMIYEGEMLPESLRGQLIHCDAGPSVTRAYVTAEDGAGYSAEIVNILEGTRDKWFRPSDVKAAPDGSLIVADWYDPGVGGHRMGDPERGRLFRVIPKNHGGEYISPEYDFETAAGAVKALRSPNLSARYLAWTALHEMGATAEPELLKLWEDNNSRMRARALWLLGKIPGRGLKYVDIASRDSDKNIRCTALRLARQLDDVDVLPVVARLVDDPASAVRRECAIALRHNEAEEAAKLWAKLASHHDGQDRWYLEALGIAADKQWDRFMTAWLDSVDGKWNTPGGRDLVWRSRAKDTGNWLSAVVEDDSVTVEQLPRYFRAMDFLSEADRDKVVTKYAFTKASSDDARAQLIATESMRRLSSSALDGKPEYKAALSRTLDNLKGTRDFVSLVSKFDVSERYGELLELAQSDPEGQLGVEAIRTLLSKGSSSLIKSALANSNLDVVNSTILALGSSSDNRSSDFLAEVVNAKSQDLEVRRNAVRAISKSRQGASRLLRGVERDRLDPSLKAVAAAALNRTRWGDIRNKAKELLPVATTKGAEQLPNLGDLARMRGEATDGEKVFAGVGTCAKCHVVNGKGKEVGPSLSEIGTKLSREAMFESILYPSAGISHNYEAYNLLDADGNQVTGLLTSSTDAEVVITTDDGIARTFQREDVELLEKQKISLMPADLQKLMSKQELLDVVEYLTTLKKK